MLLNRRMGFDYDFKGGVYVATKTTDANSLNAQRFTKFGRRLSCGQIK